MNSQIATAWLRVCLVSRHSRHQLATCGWLLLIVITSPPVGAESIPASKKTSLVDAAEQGDLRTVQALLERGQGPEQTQSDGMTALMWAVYHDDDEMTQLLLKFGADAKRANHYRVTPLSVACENGNARISQALLDAGADPNVARQGNETPLHTAARVGQVAVVQALLAHGANVNAREHHQQTPVMWASEAGHLNVVKTLVEAGADVETPLPSGFTPFFFTVREGHRELAAYLLTKGIDVNATMEPTRDFRKRPRNGTTALVLAIENGHFDLAHDLLKAGADPNTQQTGFTPLHVLTWVRKPNRGDGEDGDPPPMGSGRMTSLEMIDALVEHGADVNVQLRSRRGGRGRINHQGASPLLFAAKTADLPMIQRLVAHGADPLLPNRDRCTPLMAAAGIGTIAPAEEAGTEEEALAVIDFLLAQGADVNHVDRNGETAMHGAAYKSFPRVARRLDEAGADIAIWNKPNKYQWTPVLIAEGHRVGNFKPSFETLAALHDLMRKHGFTPPAPTPRVRRKGYE